MPGGQIPQISPFLAVARSISHPASHKVLATVDGHRIHLAATIRRASPAQCKLAPDTSPKTPPGCPPPDKPIGDEALDSAPLADDLTSDHRVELLSPHRAPHTTDWHDGRKLRRYKRPWKVEHFFAWLFNFGRLTAAESITPTTWAAFWRAPNRHPLAAL